MKGTEMGQYHIPINITRKEFISPHMLGDGLKALEQAFNDGLGSTTSALHALLMGSHERRGGGDYNDGLDGTYDPAKGMVYERTELADVAEEVLGRWACDKVVIVGDYAQETDLAHKGIEFPLHLAYSLCVDSEEEWQEYTLANYAEGTPEGDLVRQIGRFTNITPLVRAYFNGAHGVEYSGDGWVKRGEPQHG